MSKLFKEYYERFVFKVLKDNMGDIMIHKEVDEFG